MFRHLFGVGYDEFVHWPQSRYYHHKQYAEDYLRSRGVFGDGPV